VKPFSSQALQQTCTTTVIAFIGIIKTGKGLPLLSKPKEAFICIIKTGTAKGQPPALRATPF